MQGKDGKGEGKQLGFYGQPGDRGDRREPTRRKRNTGGKIKCTHLVRNWNITVQYHQSNTESIFTDPNGYDLGVPITTHFTWTIVSQSQFSVFKSDTDRCTEVMVRPVFSSSSDHRLSLICQKCMLFLTNHLCKSFWNRHFVLKLRLQYTPYLLMNLF